MHPAHVVDRTSDYSNCYRRHRAFDTCTSPVFQKKRAGAAPTTRELSSPVDQVSNDRSQALKILDERLARGEIGIEEYRSRKDELLRS
jgi:hypothetical protein